MFWFSHNTFMIFAYSLNNNCTCMYKSMMFVDACFYPYFVHICQLHKTFHFAMGAGIDYMVDS